MKKLTQTQTEELNERIATLTKGQIAIEDAFAGFESSRYELVQAIALYNEELEATEEWRDGIVTEMEDYYEEHRGDASAVTEAYSEWLSEWRCIDFKPCEMPKSLEEPYPEHAHELDQLPHEPGAI